MHDPACNATITHSCVKVTGTGHERIERLFLACCADRRTYAARATVIGFEREDDAEAFRVAFSVDH